MPRCAPFLALLLALLASACGGGGGTQEAPDPFPFDVAPPGPPPSDETPRPTPAPVPPRDPIFEADAFVHDRAVPFGAFPSDVVLWGSTVFTTDGDQIGPEGLGVVPLELSGSGVVPSTRFVTTTVVDSHLVDSAGSTGDVDLPIGFGFFANDLIVIQETLACVLINAGGSDLTPTLSNLVVFDPMQGAVLQTVDLVNPVPASPGTVDSVGQTVPSNGFRQSGAEALAFVPTGPTGGRLYVAMSNLIFGAPSYGTVKFPGTVQVFEVDFAASRPIRPLPTTAYATETIDVGGYNPVALTVIAADGATPRVLVTVAGTTAFDESLDLVPATPASVRALDGLSGAYLGRFTLGRVGLAAGRPALGRDEAGHRVGFFPSGVTGEVYLLRLDGLYASPIDTTRLAVLRGPANGIPVTAARAGGPGGNITGIGLSPDGRTLVLAGFGDLFALPTAIPGQLFLLGLPADLVTGSGFGTNFVPGSTLYGTVSGRTLGALVVTAGGGVRPDVLVSVSSPFDLSSFLATGPASLGTLHTFGLIR